MTISAEFISQIVQNVMREMQSRMSTADVAAPIELTPVKDSDTLTIGTPVISEGTLLEAGAAGRTISLLPGAVMTPSGRDYIRRNNVRVSSQISKAIESATAGTFIAVGVNTNLRTAASAAGWTTLTAATEFAAAALAADNLRSGMVTCCGGEPSVVACLLNRNSAIRAAVVTRTTNLATLTSVMNPQVVCLESSGWSFGELRRLLRGLATTGTAPRDWKEISAGGTR